MVALFFFVSGFCSILYQIVWLRLAMGTFGVIAPVLSTVLSVFMLGLGLGAWGSGRLFSATRFARWTPGTLFMAYGFWEGLAAIGALSVPLLFTVFDAHTAGSMGTVRYFASSALIIFCVLLIPCIALGATTPTALAYERSCGRDVKHHFSLLYLANVLGACAGALATPFLFIECLGFHQTLVLGVCLQMAISCGAFLLAVRESSSTSTRKTTLLPQPPAISTSTQMAMMTALFLSGFVALGCEVVWIRLFTHALGTTIYAFAGILAVYLAMSALGTGLYRLWGRHTTNRFHRGLMSLLPLATLLPLMLNQPQWTESPVRIFLSLALFCGLLGWLTPAWVDQLSHGDPRRAGHAYSVNILGCVLGPLVAGYLFLPHWGAKTSLIILAVMLGFAMVGLCLSERRHRFTLVSVLALLPVIGALASHSLEVPLSHNAVIRRDYVATVVSMGRGMDKKLFVNGVGITVLTPLTKMMAHVPILSHHGSPHKALVICFGMGTAFRSLCSWGLDTTAVELVPSVRDAFGYYFSDAADILAQPGRRIIVDDGRRFLKRTDQLYDVITLDPPPPVEAAASGLLYSREFYDLLKKHLAPKGVVQQWWPGGDLSILKSVGKTFVNAFPYVRIYKGVGGIGFHFLGSLTPMRQLTVQDARRFPELARHDFMEWTRGQSLETLWSDVIKIEIPKENFMQTDIPQLTDDHPYNEYFFLHRIIARQRHIYRTVR